MPERARGAHGWRGHPRSIPDRPATPEPSHSSPVFELDLLRSASRSRCRCSSASCSLKNGLLGLYKVVQVALWRYLRRPSRSCGHELVRQKVCRQRRSERARPPRAPCLAAPLPRLLGWQQWSGLCVCPGPSYPPSRAQVDKTTRVATTLPVSSCRARRRARGARREHTRLCECTREGGTRLWCCPGPVYALWVAPGVGGGLAI